MKTKGKKQLSEFGEIVEEFRVRAGINKGQVSKLLQISPGYYSKLIRGDRRPTYPILRRLKNELGIDPL